MHEIGHSFGGLDEGYEVGFPYNEQTSSAINNYKANYLNNAELPPNWDIEGSPKWCSGKIDTQSVCYDDYSILKRCLLSSETNNDKEASDCVKSFYEATEKKGLGRPPKCHLGLTCANNTNSWFVGNGYFRAYASDIMNSGSDSVSFVNDFEPSYGPAGEQQIENTIQTLKQWTELKKKLKNTDVKLVESRITNFDDRDRIYAKFRISDNSGNLVSIFSDELLDPTITVEYKRSEEVTYRAIGIVKKNIDGNYFIDITNYRSEKDSRLNQADIQFKINLPKFQKLWSFKVQSS